MNSKKLIGFVLVVAGVGIGAATGARNTDELKTRQTETGKADLLGGASDAAHADYCGARSAARLPLTDACPDPDAPPPEKVDNPDRPRDGSAPAKKEEVAGPTAEELAAQRSALLAAEKKKLAEWKTKPPADVAGALLDKRNVWLAAYEQAMIPRAVVATMGPLQADPTERLGQWFALAGAPFLGALALVISGALLSRSAVRAEGEAAQRPSAAGGGAVDFGTLLAEVRDDVRAIISEMEANSAPTYADADALKTRVEDIQLEKVERLVEARNGLQIRYGIAGYASVFSPFSGGERNLNRTWSALVDSHWEEATNSAKNSLSGFDDAAAELSKLAAG